MLCAVCREPGKGVGEAEKRLRGLQEVGRGNRKERCAEWESNGVPVACDFWDGRCIVSLPLWFEVDGERA